MSAIVISSPVFVRCSRAVDRFSLVVVRLLSSVPPAPPRPLPCCRPLVVFRLAPWPRGNFAILPPAGCGVVATDTIGAEPARPGSRVTDCDLNECVPEGRALFCSLKSVLGMDAF